MVPEMPKLQFIDPSALTIVTQGLVAHLGRAVHRNSRTSRCRRLGAVLELEENMDGGSPEQFWDGVLSGGCSPRME
jgi:hypothetical protein